jgi:hypothetical protein
MREFRRVRLHHVRAAVRIERLEFRIDDHPLAVFVRDVDEALRVRKRSLVVILDHHDVGARDVRAQRVFQPRLDIGRNRLLEVDPQHLLAAADDTHLENRRPVGDVDQLTDIAAPSFRRSVTAASSSPTTPM